MQLGELLGERQAEPRAFLFAPHLALDLTERRQRLGDVSRAAMPIPVSMTDIAKPPFRLALFTLTAPPSGVNFTALDRRLIRVWRRRRSAARWAGARERAWPRPDVRLMRLRFDEELNRHRGTRRDRAFCSCN